MVININYRRRAIFNVYTHTHTHTHTHTIYSTIFNVIVDVFIDTTISCLLYFSLSTHRWLTSSLFTMFQIH